jgi:hypothetical protein
MLTEAHRNSHVAGKSRTTPQKYALEASLALAMQGN